MACLSQTRWWGHRHLLRQGDLFGMKQSLAVKDAKCKADEFLSVFPLRAVQLLQSCILQKNSVQLSQSCQSPTLGLNWPTLSAFDQLNLYIALYRYAMKTATTVITNLVLILSICTLSFAQSATVDSARHKQDS